MPSLKAEIKKGQVNKHSGDLGTDISPSKRRRLFHLAFRYLDVCNAFFKSLTSPTCPDPKYRRKKHMFIIHGVDGSVRVTVKPDMLSEGPSKGRPPS